MVGWHHRLNGHEFEQALGVGDYEGSLACCSPWCCKELDTTEPTQLNWTDLQRERETTKAELESFGKSSDSEDPNSNLSSVK